MTKDNKLVFPCLPFPRIVPVSTSVKNGPFPKTSFNTALVELRNDAKELLKNWNRLGSLKETPPNSEQWGRKTEEWGSVQREGRDIWVHFLTCSHFLFYAEWVCSDVLLWSSYSPFYPSPWSVPQSQAQNFTHGASLTLTRSDKSQGTWFPRGPGTKWKKEVNVSPPTPTHQALPSAPLSVFVLLWTNRWGRWKERKVKWHTVCKSKFEMFLLQCSELNSSKYWNLLWNDCGYTAVTDKTGWKNAHFPEHPEWDLSLLWVPQKPLQSTTTRVTLASARYCWDASLAFPPVTIPNG